MAPQNHSDATVGGGSASSRQAFLLGLSDALRPVVDATEVQDIACRMLGEYLGVDWVHCSAIDPARGTLSSARDYFNGDRPSDVGGYHLAIYPLHAAACRAGRTLAIDDVTLDQSLSAGKRSDLLAHSVKTALAVPLMGRGRPDVVMAVLHGAPRAWTDEDATLVEELAERTWTAVERARAEAALREGEAKYRGLFDSIDEGFALMEVIADADGRLVDLEYREVNLPFARLAGFSVTPGARVRTLMPSIEHRAALARLLRAGLDNRHARPGRGFQRRYLPLVPHQCEPRGVGGLAPAGGSVRRHHRSQACRSQTARE